MKLLQLLWRFVALLVLTILLLPSIVYAADTVPINPSDTLASVRLTATGLAFVTGVFMPLIVGVVTNIKTSAFAKGLLLLVLDAAASFIAQGTLADGSAVWSKAVIVHFIVATASSMVFYFNAWRAKGLTSGLHLVKVVDPSTNQVTVMSVPGKLSGPGISRAPATVLLA